MTGNMKWAILCLAFVLDLLLGDPHNFPHPVRFFGAFIKKLEEYFRKKDSTNTVSKMKTYGLYILCICVLAVQFVYDIPYDIPYYIVWFVTILMIYFGNTLLSPIYIPALQLIFMSLPTVLLYQLLACRGLRSESMKVYTALKEGDIKKARKALSMIVGRDTEGLNEEGIIKASIETVAENFSDGVVAPIFYYILFSLPGAAVYKVVNTLDSMIGYKDEKYREIGFYSAKFDDVLNFLPSRLAAFLLMGAAVFFPDMNIKDGYKIFKRDRFKHASPNSAQTEAAVAGLMGLRLAGPASYFGKEYEKEYIGDELRKPEAEDIRRVNNLMYTASILFVVLSWVPCFIFWTKEG